MFDLTFGNITAWAIQVAAIGLAGVLLPLLLRVTSPRARLIYLRALLVACLVLPLLQPWVPVAAPPAVTGAPASAEDPALLDGAPGPNGSTAAGPAVVAPSRRWPLETVLLVVYVSGVAIRLAWLGLGLFSLSRLRRTSTAAEPRPAAVSSAVDLVGVDADFRVSSRVVRPVTFGLRRPVVLVPPGFLAFRPEQQTAVATHELLHVARRDWVRTLGDELILSVFWFHPALWWLIDQIHLSVEQVVDSAVVQLVGVRKPYLEALLTLAAAGPTPLLQPASAFLKHGHLAQRVALLVREASMSRLRLVASFAVVLAVLLGGGWYVVQAFPLTAIVETVAAPPAEDRISIDYQQADVRSVLTVFASISKMSVQVDPEVAGTVTVSLREVPWRQAFEVICRANNLAYRMDGNTIRVFPATASAPAPKAAPQASGQQTKPTVPPKAQASAPGPVSGAPGSLDSYFAKAKQLEAAGDFAGAEKAFIDATKAYPKEPKVFLNLAGFYNRQGQFEKTMAALTARMAIEPNNPEAPYTLATYYWDKAYRDMSLSRAVKLDFTEKGLVQADAALRMKSDYLEALTYKNLLLRMKAMIVTDLDERKALIAEADALRDQALKLKQAREAWDAVPPNAVRVGGGIAPPKKLMDVKPVYPADAQQARVQGVVIIEGVIGADGKVQAARVLRSIPQLDQAALDAVKLWEFTPTLLNGAAVPVVMTVTVNFTLDGESGGRVASGELPIPPPPPPPPPPAPLPPDTIKVGSGIQPPKKVVDVKAVYPEDAKNNGTQGVVIIEVTLGKDGHVLTAKVLRSIPALDQAAIDAVKQWVFTPTLVNGVAKNVIMTVTVNFTLQ